MSSSGPAARPRRSWSARRCGSARPCPTAASSMPAGDQRSSGRSGASARCWPSWATTTTISDHRQERDAGLDRASSRRIVLQVVGQEQEDAEHAGAGDEHRQVGAAAVAVEHDPQRQQRVRDARLCQPRTRPAGRRRRPGSPRSTRRAQPCGRRRWRTRRPGRTSTADTVTTPRMSSLGVRRGAAGWAAASAPPATATAAKIRLTYRHQRQSRYSVRTPPSSSPTAPPAPAMRAVDAERLAALLRVAERGGQQRQRGRRQQRAEHALAGAGGDQHARS